MKAVYCDRHRLQSPGTVVEGGVARPSRDVPARLDALLRAVRRAGLAVVDAVDHGTAPLAAVHTDRYLDFLAASEGTEHGPLAPAIFETRPDAYRPDWSPIGFFSQVVDSGSLGGIKKAKSSGVSLTRWASIAG